MNGCILREICDKIVGQWCMKLTFHSEYRVSLVEFCIMTTFSHRGVCRLGL
jgi:hypothetical protein